MVICLTHTVCGECTSSMPKCNGGVPHLSPHRSTIPTLLHWNSPSPRDQKTLATLNSSATSVTTRYVSQLGLYPDLHYSLIPRLTSVLEIYKTITKLLVKNT